MRAAPELHAPGLSMLARHGAPTEMAQAAGARDLGAARTRHDTVDTDHGSCKCTPGRGVLRFPGCKGKGACLPGCKDKGACAHALTRT